MLIVQAREMSEGNKMRDTVRGEEVTFLAGPFQDLNRAVYHVVGRNEDGVVKLYNLMEIASIVTPEVGEVWKDSSDSMAYIDVVSNGYVIFRYLKDDTKENATTMTLRQFVKYYYKV
ncbi:hypothetical protein SEA_PHREDRICK_256 [Streptomyces phage Phredrick]|uniref:Uncharacterized protein n=1 Tax=Streptomyces phage MeganTheeKilla TaxID=2801897 RepID=A0A7U0GCD7_9CAUD|nr:hypothetical protein SEA_MEGANTHEEKILLA_252 [Streptomyces phage MeganTheeKilla]URQ04832.1 hypothetical protein SEA_EMMA1919_251 [Streptomyces phage Emma1919]WNN94809.1 hypothetical protein SEA_PHREDRICK_256 [Streptomyces phage Phredrick]